ncbi:signal recognition particle-docking protein FtsY [Roseomonas gilardii]|uniref:Signal recognition particle receptor FtsY n=1 Tax=Roseomonas gilardii TaxID=257708 RepID=A0ABU3MHP2_9PROT|nr:signal recognition particle-docking protein FtsY [Roseomonas gilardii]MDT8331949.1 signal recognition particle-docking protein FtsY [Roseomonas gilardii]
MALKNLWNRLTGRAPATETPAETHHGGLPEPFEPPPPDAAGIDVWSNPIPAVAPDGGVPLEALDPAAAAEEEVQARLAQTPPPLGHHPDYGQPTAFAPGAVAPGNVPGSAPAAAPASVPVAYAPPPPPAVAVPPPAPPVAYVPPAPPAAVPVSAPAAPPAVARASDPVPVPPPVQEPPPPIPVPPDEEPDVEEPPPADIPDLPPAEEPGTPPPVREPPASAGFFGRLKAGLQRSTQRLTENLTGLFTKRPLDDAALEDLEDTLITADLGVAASRRIVEGFRRTRFGKEVSDEEVKSALAGEITEILAPVATPLVPEPGTKPFVVLMVGVNGTGKTTTIAKLSEQWRGEGRRVMLAAGDTFRAAAVEQLQVWGDRTGAPVVAPARPGADAAGLAHEALDRAVAEGMDVLLIDTAGRLHNKAGLMEELRKVVRVLKKKDPAVPHATILVLDATTGQNAIQQCKVFQEMVDITGLVVTKLDGSAKGGVVVALAQEFGLPVHAVGVGEKAADLRPFDPRDFARSLVGLA